MYIPGELLILFIPVIVGFIKGEVVWNSEQKQFTMTNKGGGRYDRQSYRRKEV